MRDGRSKEYRQPIWTGGTRKGKSTSEVNRELDYDVSWRLKWFEFKVKKELRYYVERELRGYLVRDFRGLQFEYLWPINSKLKGNLE